MSEELKPCPFCGGTDIGHSPGSIIACMNNNCGGNVDIGPPWGGPKEDGIAFLIAAWNTRTPPADRSVGELTPPSVADIADSELLRRAVRNANPNQRGKGPHWIAVSDTFVLGSTYSRQLCRRFGVDPDGVGRVAPTETEER